MKIRRPNIATRMRANCCSFEQTNVCSLIPPISVSLSPIICQSVGAYIYVPLAPAGRTRTTSTAPLEHRHTRARAIIIFALWAIEFLNKIIVLPRYLSDFRVSTHALLVDSCRGNYALTYNSLFFFSFFFNGCTSERNDNSSGIANFSRVNIARERWLKSLIDFTVLPAQFETFFIKE